MLPWTIISRRNIGSLGSGASSVLLVLIFRGEWGLLGVLMRCRVVKCRSGTTVPYVVERIISQGSEINDNRYVLLPFLPALNLNLTFSCSNERSGGSYRPVSNPRSSSSKPVLT